MMIRATVLLLVLFTAACAQSRAPRPMPPATPAVSNPPPAEAAVVTAPASGAEDEAPAARPPQGSGPWRVAAVSVRTPEGAAPYVKQFQAAGFRAETEAAVVEGKDWQRVVLPGYTRFAHARATLAAVIAELPGATPWVLPRTAPPAEATQAAPAPAAAPVAPAPPRPENEPTPKP